jgi:hypothetical protein
MAVFILISSVVLMTAALTILLVLYFGALKSLARFEGIASAEDHVAACQQQAMAATQQYQSLMAQGGALHDQLTAQKAKVVQYQQLLGNLNTAADLQQRIERDTGRMQQLATNIGKLERVSQIDGYLKSQEAQITQKAAELAAFQPAIGAARSAAEIHAQVEYYQNFLAVLKADVEAVEETRSLHEFAFYRPHYDFNSSDEYENRLEWVHKQQKKLLTGKEACVCKTDWTVDGSKSQGQKMVTQQIKLMLRAFNGECDAAVGKVRFNNMVTIENRIARAYEQINKLGETKRIHIEPSYYQLKIDELRLAYEYQLKKEEEREEQRAIREQMKEEEKVEREIEKACEAADREEALKAQALEQARAELSLREGAQAAKLESLVLRLENELQEAIDRKAKAIARAQLTRSGHVYILSNVGTFGEGVHKIGMSRRLEPLERVNELGGASVPFPFDVHAMIYCEDAPALEATLHRHFAQRRVNLVNLRREFFHVTLDEVRAAVAQYHGHITFVTIPEAAQYQQTLALRKQSQEAAPALQIA